MSANVTTSASSLFEPLEIRGLELRNRVVFLPHVTFYADGQRPSNRHRHYYEERARGGVGLIVTESQTVHATGGHGHCVDASHAEGMHFWREAIDAVHAHGTRIFAQLTHHGIEAHTPDTLLPQWAPSAIGNPVVGETPHAMTEAEIAVAQDAFGVATTNAVAAGFDGVELKVGHDGLLRTFLSPFFNHREDGYGGSPEGRARFVVETLEVVRAALGDRPLGIRFCLDEGFPGGYDLAQGVAYAKAIAATGLIDYLSTDLGTWLSLDIQVPPMTVPEGFADEAVAAVKDAIEIPVIAFGRIKSPAHAERLLSAGHADLIGMARQLITDPEWALKVQDGRGSEIRPCVGCNQECVGRLVRTLPISCVHNPAAGREEALGVTTLSRATQPRRVLVVGGGPAGLKAAEVAARRGHRVTLVEREGRLGGQVALAATAPGHEEWGGIVDHLIGRLDSLEVDVQLSTELDADTTNGGGWDTVIVATGATPGPWPFPVHDEIAIFDEWQVMRGDGPAGKSVLLLDLGVRYEGAALAETLAARGNAVRWLAPTPTVGFEIDPPSLMSLLPRLAAHGVVRSPETTIIEASSAGVTLLNVFTREIARVDGVDAIVVAGNKRARALSGALDPSLTVRQVGDCVAPRHVAIAILEGERAGREA